MANGSVDDVLGLADRDPHAPLRPLARFGHDIARAHRVDHLAAALGAGAETLAVRDGGDLVGAVVHRSVPDLTEHFEQPVHEVVALLSEPDGDRRRLAHVGLDALRDLLAVPTLVLLRLEGDDLEAAAGASAVGYRLRETSLSFVNDLARRDLNPPRSDADVRVHRFADGPLPDEVRAAVRRGRTSFVDDHYHADPRLDRARCDDLYDRVRDRVVEGIGADVLVSRHLDGHMVGFGTWRRARELEPYGVAMVDNAFGFRLPGAPAGNLSEVGAYVCDEPLLENRLLEWSTQATNYPMVNMLCRRPSIRLCRTTQVLHGWSDER
ncbi:MAG: hypothetical protein R2711_09530 [Acidimicrobiales bacterium]